MDEKIIDNEYLEFKLLDAIKSMLDEGYSKEKINKLILKAMEEWMNNNTVINVRLPGKMKVDIEKKLKVPLSVFIREAIAKFLKRSK